MWAGGDEDPNISRRASRKTESWLAGRHEGDLVLLERHALVPSERGSGRQIGETCRKSLVGLGRVGVLSLGVRVEGVEQHGQSSESGRDFQNPIDVPMRDVGAVDTHALGNNRRLGSGIAILKTDITAL